MTPGSLVVSPSEPIGDAGSRIKHGLAWEVRPCIGGGLLR